jgi:hypothetical protein
VPAVGGTRFVPAPDPVAADYLLLGLRFDQHMPGLVDGYFGPADLKARADTEQKRSPTRLRDDVAALSDRVAREIEEADRREWLAAQLDALDAHARALGGDALPYIEYVERCMGFPPRRHHEAEFEEAVAEIDDVLPGPGSVAERLEAWDRELEVPVERIPSMAEWLLDRFRQRASGDFGLPDRESIRLQIVRDQPWIAYCWYEGGRRSRVDINVDLPVTASDLIVTIAHEAYPGHHLESAWKEADLVDRRRWLESSLILTNTPQGPVSEGLARFGTRFASPLDQRAGLLVELFERAGMAVAADRARAADMAEKAVALIAPRDVLEAATDEAALKRHADGVSHDEALTYLREVGRYAPDVAAKRLEFIEDPLSRLYVFAYERGEALVTRWVETAEAPDRVGRFGRLLHELVTPGRLLADPGGERRPAPAGEPAVRRATPS